MSEEKPNIATGLCSFAYMVVQIVFCILSIISYSKYVINDHGQYGPEYSYIISWFYKIGIYCIISLCSSFVSVIITCVSSAESYACIDVYTGVAVTLGYCACCWLLAEGIAVNNTFSYPCTHMSEFNDTTMISGNGTIVCNFYNDQFSTLFIYYCVLFGFSTFVIFVICIVGLYCRLFIFDYLFEL